MNYLKFCEEMKEEVQKKLGYAYSVEIKEIRFQIIMSIRWYYSIVK